jgi:hypothetical protein
VGVSDQCQHLVFLDVDAEVAQRVASEVQQWLLAARTVCVVVRDENASVRRPAKGSTDGSCPR